MRISLIILAVIILAVAQTFGARAAAASFLLQPGPHLFLDDFLVEGTSNVVRRINTPQRDLPQPVVTGKDDKNFQPYVTVLRDPQTQRLRM